MRFAHFMFGRIGVVSQQLDRGDQHPRRAVAALQREILEEVLLHGMPRAVLRAQPLDGDDLGAVGLHRKREARARAAPVQRDRAGAAHAVLATEMRAGEMQMIPQEIRKREADRHGLLVGPAVHGHRDALLSSQRRALPPAPARLVQGLLGHDAGQMPPVG